MASVGRAYADEPTSPPPAPAAEKATVHPGTVWIPGHWEWHTIQWRWAYGHEEALRPGWRLSAAHWDRDANSGAYVFTEASWVPTRPVGLTRSDGSAVANGCGPGFTRWADEAGDGTRFADDHTFLGGEGYNARDSPAYIANFRDACDLHDAAYEGCGPSNPVCPWLVYDAINNRVLDYSRSTVSRKAIDDQFLEDMRTLCEHMTVMRDGVVVSPAPKDAGFASFAIDSCRQRGQGFVLGAWGAETLYRLVRKHGRSSFQTLGGRRSSE